MTPYYEDAAVRIYHGDCRSILPTLEPVDHVITDPPYSEHVHASTMRGAAGWKGAPSERMPLGFDALTVDVRREAASHIARLTRRWALVFSDTESAHDWATDLDFTDDHLTDMDYVRTAFWRKVGGAPQFTGDRPAVACEAITICHRRGKKRWNGGGKQGFYEVPIVLSRGGHNEPRVHTTQKPLELMAQLVTDFTDPGDLILDPFGGSGTTAVAAKRLGRRCILIEREEKYCAVAAKRLAQGALALFESEAST